MVKTNLIIVPIFVFFVLVIPDVGGAFGLQYTNYTRDKYQIQFQYPSDWLVQEKPHRFEEGSEIDLSNNKIGSGEIAIHFYNDLLEGFGTTDFDLAFADFYNGRATDSFDYEYATVKSPSFLNVDDQKTGTFLMMFKQRDETDPIIIEVQYWITFVADNGYIIEFMSTPENFNSSDNIEVRDRFIESINFLGLKNNTESVGRISTVANFIK